MPEESLAVVGGRVKLTLRSEKIEKAKGTGAFTGSAHVPWEQ